MLLKDLTPLLRVIYLLALSPNSSLFDLIASYALVIAYHIEMYIHTHLHIHTYRYYFWLVNVLPL